MRFAGRRCWALAFLMALAIAPIGATSLAQPSGAAEAEKSAAIRFADRLAALRPTDPEEYFRLAEDVADLGDGFGETRLAIRLYTLAFELGRRSGRASLAGSAAMGLASRVRSDRERQWLSMVARIVDTRQSGASWIVEREAANADSAPYQLATAMGLVRSGEGPAARRLLDLPSVQAIAERNATMLGMIGISGGAASLTRESWNWPCRECANSRALRRGSGNPPELKLCSNCAGNPGPALSTEELAGQLRFESLLLEGKQRSWASQLAADHGAPLVQANADEVSDAMGVDPRRCIWRDGEWVEGELPPLPREKEEAAPPALKRVPKPEGNEPRPDPAPAGRTVSG